MLPEYRETIRRAGYEIVLERFLMNVDSVIFDLVGHGHPIQIALSGLEELENSTPEAREALIKAKIENAERAYLWREERLGSAFPLVRHA